jgi:8-amino-3,8-dideoxy-alpha-D-manno-octulosonate transaminase
MASLVALRIGEGDEVIVPGYTFIASISSILLVGARPVLAEIDESLTIDPDDIERRITPKTKAIMPVHMLGNPCDMDRIMDIASKHGLFVIEDCCQAAGAKYRGSSVGSIGDIGAFSLNTFKTITSGEGGMVVTDDDNRYELAFGFHDQGHKPLRMGIEVGKRSVIGMNMRINELTGAVALAQTRKIPYIMSLLKDKKDKLKQQINRTSDFTFRKINDEDGECHTLLTILFRSKDKADRFGDMIGTKSLIHSGWHV